MNVLALVEMEMIWALMVVDDTRVVRMFTSSHVPSVHLFMGIDIIEVENLFSI